MSRRDKRDRISQETTRQAGGYLFNLPTDESKALDMRTRIISTQMSEYLLYLGILGSTYGSQVAQDIKDSTERLLISKKGKGREEAVQVLNQNFPKRVEVEKGWDDES